MLVANVAGIIGNEPERRQVGSKYYWAVSVSHHIDSNNTMWVNVMIPEAFKVAEYLHKGGRLTAIGSLTVKVYEDKPNLTIWATNVENLTQRV